MSSLFSRSVTFHPLQYVIQYLVYNWCTSTDYMFLFFELYEFKDLGVFHFYVSGIEISSSF